MKTFLVLVIFLCSAVSVCYCGNSTPQGVVNSQEVELAINVGKVLGAAEAFARNNGIFAPAFSMGPSQYLFNPLKGKVFGGCKSIDDLEPGQIHYETDNHNFCTITGKLPDGRTIVATSKLPRS